MISQRSPHPSQRQPWPGENMPLPVRIDGWRVLSAIKLLPQPNQPNQPLHQWVLITECPGALFSLARVSYRDNGYHTDDSAGMIDSYSEAVTWMIKVAASVGTPSQLTDSRASS